MRFSSAEPDGLVPIYTGQFVCHFARGCDGRIDPLRLSAEIGVERANDDACMVMGSVLVKTEEVASIVSE
jgi:hypothetical protein